MSILHRIARLLRADVHGFIDFLEEPDVMLKQALREMEQAIIEREKKCDLLRSECDKLLGSQAELRETLNSLEEKISLCLVERNDGLAKKFIRRKLEARKHLGVVQCSSIEKEKELETTEQSLEADRSKYQEIVEKARILGKVECKVQQDVDVSCDEVEVEFLREKRKYESFGTETEQGGSHEAM